MARKPRKYTPVKCHWCGEKIEKEEDRVKLHVTEKQEKNFHKHCEREFLEENEKKRIEWESWDALYKYVRFEILGYTQEKQLTPHQRQRLQALRNGTFYVRGKMHNQGYSYDVILITFKAKKVEIEKGIYNKTFDSENQKFNYIMAIIQNNIIDIAKKLDQAKKDKEKEGELIHTIKTVDVKDAFEEYKALRKKSKTPSLLDEL